jgi:dTDP-glucose pyrophosphorylase
VNKDRLSKFIGNKSISIVDAMAQIDANARGILFVTDDLGRLIGCISDGDIRRWILNAVDINAPVTKAMNPNPKYLFVDERGKSTDLMNKESITALPLINIKMEVCDLILFSETSDESCIKEKRDLSDVPVVVMAGGKGTRLYPFTKILPKPLIPIGDTPIVERIIDCFTKYGIRKYYITVNYKKGMIKAYFAELNPPYDIEYVEETKPLGTGGSIKLIKDVFNKPLFVTNCDALILADYGDIYDYHIASGNDITMISSLKNFTVPYGVVHTGDNGELLSMEEKPKLSYFINSGMYIINPETIELIPDDTLFHMTHLVDAVMKKGGKVGAYPISEDSFLDMGEFSEMKRMEEKLDIVSE